VTLTRPRGQHGSSRSRPAASSPCPRCRISPKCRRCTTWPVPPGRSGGRALCATATM